MKLRVFSTHGDGLFTYTVGATEEEAHALLQRILGDPLVVVGRTSVREVPAPSPAEGEAPAAETSPAEGDPKRKRGRPRKEDSAPTAEEKAVEDAKLAAARAEVEAEVEAAQARAAAEAQAAGDAAALVASRLVAAGVPAPTNGSSTVPPELVKAEKLRVILEFLSGEKKMNAAACIAYCTANAAHIPFLKGLGDTLAERLKGGTAALGIK